jgi:hypothetical protein
MSAMRNGLAALFTLLAGTGLAHAQSEAPAEPAQEPEPSFWDKFIDPEDGMFDLGGAIEGGFGFVPVPIIITDPALGVGGGVALSYIHPTDTSVAEDRRSPNSVTGLAGMATTNGSWLAGVGHKHYFANDSVRYAGLLGTGKLNLDFYGTGPETSTSATGVEFQSDILATSHEISARMFGSPVFLGVGYGIAALDSNFALGTPLPVDPTVLDSRIAGVSLVARYDTLNNQFSPTEGVAAELRSVGFSEAVGSDFDFVRSYGSWIGYWHIYPRAVISGRVVGESIAGSAPFYALPFIMLRGIPALRYQGNHVLTAEIELRVGITDRWKVVGFSGMGIAADTFDALDDEPTRVTNGVGLRYLTARKLGLETGLDLAYGPEETTLYVTIGSGW